MSSPVEQILGGPKEGPIGKVWGGIEGVYDSIGLMSGDGAEARRFVFGFLVGSGIMYLAKPAVSFSPDGTARPWSLLQPGDRNKTAVPWWLPGAAFGFFSGFMV